jgi:hypothetical protein
VLLEAESADDAAGASKRYLTKLVEKQKRDAFAGKVVVVLEDLFELKAPLSRPALINFSVHPAENFSEVYNAFLDGPAQVTSYRWGDPDKEDEPEPFMTFEPAPARVRVDGARKSKTAGKPKTSATASAGEVSPMALRRWAELWSNTERDRGVRDWKRNKAWLVELVLPDLGDLLVREIRTPHIVSLFTRLRTTASAATGKPRAPRTMHNIHQVAHRCLADAVLAGHLDHAPESLDERHLGRKLDADPEWRATALFTRDEVQTLISSPRIPWDRRVAYALEL